jgi:hypothetical protein
VMNVTSDMKVRDPVENVLLGRYVPMELRNKPQP